MSYSVSSSQLNLSSQSEKVRSATYSVTKQLSALNSANQMFCGNSREQRRKSSFGTATDDPFNPPNGGMESMEQRRMRNKAATTQLLEWLDYAVFIKQLLGYKISEKKNFDVLTGFTHLVDNKAVMCYVCDSLNILV